MELPVPLFLAISAWSVSRNPLHTALHAHAQRRMCPFRVPLETRACRPEAQTNGEKQKNWERLGP